MNHKTPLLFVSIFTIFLSCNNKKVAKVDFSKTRTIRSDASIAGKSTGFAFDSAQTVVIDDNDLFGHYLGKTKILLSIDQNKRIRYECETLNTVGTMRKSAPITDLALISGIFRGNNMNGDEVRIGGNKRIIYVAEGVFFVFESEEDAVRIFRLLNRWAVAVMEEQSNEDSELNDGTKI